MDSAPRKAALERTETRVTRWLVCPYVGCEERWQHRGGMTLTIAESVYAEHERVDHPEVSCG